MQLLGANPSGEGRPNPVAGLAGGFGTDLAPATVRRGRWSRLGRRGARARITRRRLRREARGHLTERAGLPSPLLTPPMAIPNPLRDKPDRPSECGFDTLTFGSAGTRDPRVGRRPAPEPAKPTDQSGIPWPRPAKENLPPQAPVDDDDGDDTAPLAIDLSDGPKLIHHPAPAPPEATEAPEPATDSGLPLPVHTRTGPPTPPQGVARVGVDLSPAPPAALTEPRRIPEALLTTVLAVIASVTAWAIAASPQVWVSLSAVPAAGLLALLLPGGSAARVLRATALFGTAAVLPVLDPAMTPVCLVIALATVALYPLLLGPVAGWVVTTLAVAAPAAALIGRTLIDGPERVARLLLHPQANPSVGIQIALGSGVLVAALVGYTSTATRRRLAGAASAAQAAERQARAEAAAVAASSSVDQATGLPNRDGLLRAVALILTEPDPITRGSTQPPVGLVLADLERFDDLADSLGVGVADELAEQTGRRIAEAFGDYLVARVGRHQFAVVLTEDVLSPNPDTCADMARSITRLMDEPVRAGGREFTLSCALGGAVSGPGLINAEDLLQAADAAVRTARREGRGRWSMFDRAVRARSRHRAGLETELRQAIARGVIEVDFQPLLALGSSLEQDDHITGAEALPRWRRHDGSTVPPQTFVPLADELGLGVTLGLQTINRALAALVIWRHEGVGVEQVWVSLSPAQLEDPDFAHEVAAQLAIRGLAASSLTLQIGAGELVESGQSLLTLGMLRSLGIAVALNDFGCGGTSLTMLRRLPIGAVKLDGRLAAELGAGDAVPRAAAQLCHSLGLKVICGEVQTSGQLEGARQIGADAVQGQAIARPMSAQDVTNLLTLRMPRALRQRSPK